MTVPWAVMRGWRETGEWGATVNSPRVLWVCLPHGQRQVGRARFGISRNLGLVDPAGNGMCWERSPSFLAPAKEGLLHPGGDLCSCWATGRQRTECCRGGRLGKTGEHGASSFEAQAAAPALLFFQHLQLFLINGLRAEAPTSSVCVKREEVCVRRRRPFWAMGKQPPRGSWAGTGPDCLYLTVVFCSLPPADLHDGYYL